MEWLEIAGNDKKWLDMAENCLNCWKMVEMAGMAGYGWKWLDMA